MYAGYWIMIKGYNGSELRSSDSSHIIVNNTLGGSPRPDGYAQIRIVGDSSEHKPKNLIIENNASYNTIGNTLIRWRKNVPLSGYIRNNVISGKEILYIDGGTPTGSVVETGNKTDLALSSFGMRNPDNNDFRLTDSATKLIDAGLYVNAPSDDYNGNSRGSAPDVGAYELTGQAQSTDIPEPPTNLKIIQLQ
jgi:hypothetical protein